jgi:hypothetical protein
MQWFGFTLRRAPAPKKSALVSAAEADAKSPVASLAASYDVWGGSFGGLDSLGAAIGNWLLASTSVDACVGHESVEHTEKP